MATSSSSCSPAPTLSGQPARGKGRRAGQALVEFAVALPILILLVGGTLEVGRGYTIAVATSNAARDGARIVAGKTPATNGPGIAGMCSIVTADLAAVTSSVVCATQVGHAPPFIAGTDFTGPVDGQAVVVVYCGTSANCTGSPSPLYQSEVDVGVYYGFNDLNLFGGLITISGSSRATTSW